MTEILISKRNSLILKGVGIFLMFIHHLFFNDWTRDLYDDVIVSGVGIVNQIGVFSKVCVSIFVFISGYGLVISTPKDIKLKDFYQHRFKKLYLNYWYIWIVFVPISVFVFKRTFADAYGSHVVVKAILDFLGLLKITGIDGFNPTWWFYSCIIILYLLFPFLNKYLWRTPYLMISLSITCGLLGIIPGINVISSYIFVFIVGMLISKIPLTWVENTKWWHIVLAIIFISGWRFTRTCPKDIADSLLCVGMAFFLYKVPVWNWLCCIFENFGKHSMNMFLTHTFVYYFWFRDYIYITRNPILILMSLLLTSYYFSVVIEWSKRKLGFYRI